MQFAETAPTPSKPVDFYTAADSQNNRAMIKLVSSPTDWSIAWQQYRSGDTIGNGVLRPADIPPTVDFIHNYVIAVFSGPQSISGYQLVDSFVQDKALHVRLQPVSAPSPSAIRLQNYAVAFVVYARQSLPIDVEFPLVDSSGTVTWNVVRKLGD
jgi:hypothetical protein